MYSSEHYFKLAKTRRDEILREAEVDRWLQSTRPKPFKKISPGMAWALVGPAFAMILLILIV